MKTIQTKWLALSALALTAVTVMAWKSATPLQSVREFSPGLEEMQDTTPVKKKMHIDKDHEYILNDLDGSMEELDKAMRELDVNLKTDLGKLNKEIRITLDQLKNIDMAKLSDEINSSMKNINWTSLHKEVSNAMKEAELQLKNIDLKEVDKQVKKAMEHVRTDISIDLDQQVKRSLEAGLEGAREGIARAKKEIQLLKEFTTELEKDGLIDKKKGYKLEIKDDEMYIDGKKQTKEVTDKYRKYFKDGNYTLKSDGHSKYENFKI